MGAEPTGLLHLPENGFCISSPPFPPCPCRCFLLFIPPQPFSFLPLPLMRAQLLCRVFFYILQRKARLLQQSNAHKMLPGLGGTSSAPLLSPHPSFSLSVTARALTVAFGVTSPQSEVFSPMLSGLGRSNLSFQVAREGRASSAP